MKNKQNYEYKHTHKVVDIPITFENDIMNIELHNISMKNKKVFQKGKDEQVVEKRLKFYEQKSKENKNGG